jgi:PTH1 family peptidyl-tRNA hydrolase
LVADELRAVENFSTLTMNRRAQARVCEGSVGGHLCTLAYPETFMNHSGVTAAALVPKDRREQLIVIHDEVALPLGNVKVSFGSGAAGHNGVASIIAALGTTAFVRVRVGIGAPVATTLEQFVLAQFTDEELTRVPPSVTRAVAVVRTVIADGYQAAMNEWNGLS